LKITILKKDPKVYCANVYFVQGDWNTMDDVNTLIDVGTNDFIIKELDDIASGVGKKKVSNIILTHEHFDHAAALPIIIDYYTPDKIYGRGSLKGITDFANDGIKLRVADEIAEILYTPGHSNDSICIYFERTGVLFSGDTPLNIKSTGGSYNLVFLEALDRLRKLNITSIYSGHDEPILVGAKELIETTYKNVKNSNVVI
jgi:glyoxylase-like metal-dependent hydrolase (beta-lactamase superfamily II)